MKHKYLGQLLIPLFLVLISFSLNAQKYIVEGYVQDSSDLALETASVILLQKVDSVLTGFSITNNKGLFRVDDVKQGEYILQVTYLGYADYSQILKISGDTKRIELGIIKMEASDEILPGATIIADHVPIKIKKDTIEYNADAFKVEANEAVEELLKKLPGIEVEKDGTIKAHGEEVEKVMVEGKEFFGNDPTIATKNLPADAVGKVQVFDKQSEMAEFSGIDDGERTKTINLTLKEGKKRGYFGSGQAGYGTDERYQAKFNVNSFTKNSQLTAIGMLNNINEQGFSFNDYIQFMGGMGNLMSGGSRFNPSATGINLSSGLSDGFVRTGAGGLNFNLDPNEKTEFHFSYFYNNIKNQIDRDITRTSLTDQDEFNSDIFSSQNSLSKNHKISTRLKHEIDSTQNFTLELSAGYNDGNSALVDTTFNLDNSNNLISSSFRNNQAEAEDFDISGVFSYRKRLKKLGRFFTARIRGGIDQSDQFANLYSENAFIDTMDVITIIQEQEQRNDQWNYNARLSYTEPLGRRKYLEFNYTRSNTNNDFDKLFYDIDPGSDPDRIFNEQLSNAYIRDYYYDIFGTNFKVNRENYNLTIGASYQFSTLNGEFDENRENINKGFNNFLPSLRFNYDISNNSRFRINYSTSIQEPSLDQLQPIVDNSDPLNIYVGNPDLEAAYRHRMRVNFNTYSQFSSIGFFGFLNITYTDDHITNQTTVNDQLIQLTSPINVDYQLRTSFYSNFNAPLKFIDSKINVGLDLSNTKGFTFINRTENQTNRWSNSFNISLENRRKNIFDWKIGADIGQNTNKYDISTELNQTFFENIYYCDFSVDFLRDWNIESSINYTTYSQENFGDEDQIPIWHASISRIFLKGRKGKLELGATDILNRNTNINRSSTRNFLQEEKITTLQRYVMLTFSYSFSGFGNKDVKFGGWGRRRR